MKHTRDVKILQIRRMVRSAYVCTSHHRRQRPHFVTKSNKLCAQHTRVSIIWFWYSRKQYSYRMQYHVLWLRLKVSSPFRQQFKWQSFLIRLLVSGIHHIAYCVLGIIHHHLHHNKLDHEFRNLLCAAQHNMKNGCDMPRNLSASYRNVSCNFLTNWWQSHLNWKHYAIIRNPDPFVILMWRTRKIIILWKLLFALWSLVGRLHEILSTLLSLSFSTFDCLITYIHKKSCVRSQKKYEVHLSLFIFCCSTVKYTLCWICHCYLLFIYANNMHEKYVC